MNRRDFLIGSFALLGGMGGASGGARAESTSPVGRQADSRPKAAIVGAGVAGLAAARYLGEKGWDVDVLERDDHIGGLCSTLVIEGFRFDLGPHIFSRLIGGLVPFKPGDLCPAAFTEAFLMDGKLRRFPGDLLTPSFIFDLSLTLAKNTFNSDRLKAARMEDLAEASYGPKANNEIFKPLLEKWCGAHLEDLDPRYFAGRMHSRLEAAWLKTHFWKMADRLTKKSDTRTTEQAAGSSESIDCGVGNITEAPGYSGRIGARIVPDRLSEAVGSVRLHPGRALTAVEVDKGRVSLIQAGDMQFKPDFVISTIPLNRLAGLVRGSDQIARFRLIEYLNVVFVFARIAGPSIQKTEWTWIPDRSVPFYRMSEMKTLNKENAPENATGLCLEATVPEGSAQYHEPDKYWTDLAHRFLDSSLGVKRSKIMGMDVVRRESAYPSFTFKNTDIISRSLEKTYVAGTTSHEFRTGVENLAMAGRAGTFLYLLTPWAIQSGRDAAGKAVRYWSSKAARPLDSERT
ncbi:MAG: FAD-dependent oxidoreductase [Pseudomonadota bacterium]